MNTEKPPILLVGSGAMASLFAAIFSANGMEVRMLGTWQENLRAINEEGVRLIDQDGQETIHKVEAIDDPEECAGSRFAIVLVKSYQTKYAAKRLARCLAEDGIVLTLQNGLGNDEILANYLGSTRVVTGVTTLGATLVSPGVVRIGGQGVISIGDHEKAAIPAGLLSQADFQVEIVPDTSSLVWGKLVINASINPLTALLEVRNGELLKNKSAHRLMNDLTNESAAVARGISVELPFKDPEGIVENVALKTASNYSSMYIDTQRGGLTEIDAINGAIVRTGEQKKIPVGINRVMWLLVKARTEYQASPAGTKI